jgi:spore germination cell wall hydrolase CwlJ-like protein
MFSSKKSKILISTLIAILLVLATTGFAVNRIDASQPIRVSYNQLSDEAKEEVKCLADNIYFESAFEPYEGRVAVAMVTMNRLVNNYSDTVCGVVKQRIRSTCQFSWWCQERERSKAISGYLTLGVDPYYDRAIEIAIMVYLNYGNIEDPSKGALFYHADYVNPKWRNLTVSNVIGRHIFYVTNDKFKKGDVPNGTNDEEIKFRTVFEQRSGSVPLFLFADGRY